MLKHILACGFIVLLGTPLVAETVISQVDFSAMPKDSKCGAVAKHAKAVKVRVKRKETQIKIIGNATGATFFCDLPNGKRITAILPDLPVGTKTANLQVRPDRSGALILDTEAGIKLINVDKAAKLSN